MEGIFREFENENALRSYPFAAGCVQDESRMIPDGLFIDAAIYPMNPEGDVYLSGISSSGVFSVSDDTGVILEGSQSGSSVELYDTSAFRRHAGTLVASSEDALSEFAGRGADVEYGREETTFASSCVFPVVCNGVTSVSSGGSGAKSGDVSFANGPSDDVRVSSGTLQDGRRTLRFDVLTAPRPDDTMSIRRIICVVDGQTPFRIERSPFAYNTVMLRLEGADRDDVCAAAHREDQYEMSDTCGCEKKIPSGNRVPDAYGLVEVFIPPDEDMSDGGVPEGAENAFYIVAPNISGHVNPISITLVDGEIIPKTKEPEAVIEDGDARIEDGGLTDSLTSKGVVIQVPGLSGGET